MCYVASEGRAYNVGENWYDDKCQKFTCQSGPSFIALGWVKFVIFYWIWGFEMYLKLKKKLQIARIIKVSEKKLMPLLIFDYLCVYLSQMIVNHIARFL